MRNTGQLRSERDEGGYESIKYQLWIMSAITVYHHFEYQCLFMFQKASVRLFSFVFIFSLFDITDAPYSRITCNKRSSGRCTAQPRRLTNFTSKHGRRDDVIVIQTNRPLTNQLVSDHQGLPILYPQEQPRLAPCKKRLSTPPPLPPSPTTSAQLKSFLSFSFLPPSKMSTLLTTNILRRSRLLLSQLAPTTSSLTPSTSASITNNLSRRSFSNTSTKMVQTGDAIPSIELYENSPGNKVNLAEVLKSGKGVIIGVPAAFSTLFNLLLTFLCRFCHFQHFGFCASILATFSSPHPPLDLTTIPPFTRPKIKE